MLSDVCISARLVYMSMCMLCAWVGLEKFLGGGPNIVDIKVGQFDVILELQLRTSLVISQVPV